MSPHRCAILVLVLAGLPCFSVGQNPPPQNTNPADASATRPTPAPALSGVIGVDTQPSEKDSGNDLPRIPALLGGTGSSLAFTSEMERSNYVRGGLNVGAAYDDNAFLAPGSGVGNTTYSVFPNIAIDQSTSRMRWSLNYGAGLTVNQRFSSQNQGSHNLTFDSQFRLSPHVNLRVAEDFSLTAGVFGASGTADANGGGPNASLITPLARQRASLTTVGSNYQFALKDVVGASGSFYDLHFGDVPAGTALTNTRSASGSAFWFHQLFRGDWAGTTYRFDRLTFGSSNDETRVHSFLAVNTLGLGQQFTLSVFFGPEYSDSLVMTAGDGGPGQSSHTTHWSFAGGVDAGWQRDHRSLTAGYSRRVNDGGGVLGAVRLQNVHADFRQELLPGLSVSLGASYGNNKSLTVPTAGSATSVDLTSVRASLERNLGRSLGLRFMYFHDFQKQFGVSDPPQDLAAHRNRYSVTLFYQWAKPIGR